MPQGPPSSDLGVTSSLAEIIRDHVTYSRQLRILGLISYLVDDDPKEHFLKVDIKYGPQENSINPDGSQPVAEQDSVISTNCPTPGSIGDHQASSSSSSSETELTRVIHSSPTVSILSTLPPKSRPRPYPRFTLTGFDSALNEDECWLDCDVAASTRNRRDRRKSRKPRRQLMPNSHPNEDQSISYHAAAFSPPILGISSPEPNVNESMEEDIDRSPALDDSLSIALLPSDIKGEIQTPSDESQHNKSSSSPSSGCQLDDDDEKETIAAKVGIVNEKLSDPNDNKTFSNSLSSGLALLGQNTYGLLLRGPFTLSTTPSIVTTEASKPVKVASTQNFPSQLSSSGSVGGSGKGNYKCRYCDKLFNRKFCRERHERLHTGVKPYTCEVCAEKFIRLEDKKRHLRLNHPGSSHDTGPVSPTLNSVSERTFPVVF